MAEYRQGTGPERLPQGAATQLNENAPPADDRDLALENTEIPVVIAPGEDEPVDNDDTHLSENMQVLVDGPNPDYRGPVIPKDRQGRVPKYMVRHLPLLMAAVRSPDTPPTLRALYATTIRHLERELQEGR